MNRRRKRRSKVNSLSSNEQSFVSKIVSSLFSLVLLVLCCCAVVLSERIYSAGGFEPVVEKWEQISSTLNLTHLKGWIFLENWINNQTMQVSSSSYQHVSDQLYEVDQHEVRAVGDGLVIYCSEDEEGKMVMVRQDNGLIVTYDHLNEVFCKEDDRLLEGAMLGKVQDLVVLDFSWQGESISYEQALAFEN